MLTGKISTKTTSSNTKGLDLSDLFVNLDFLNKEIYKDDDKLNNKRYINKYFESVNHNLSVGAGFVFSLETNEIRKKNILKKYPRYLNYLLYSLDVIINRILPKLSITKKFYFFITKGKTRVISKAETFGRLYSCGFELVDAKVKSGYLHVLARKIREPFFDKKPTYGLIIRLPRLGKNGKIFNVYKFRTMHPYSEYLQEYMQNRNKLDNSGKIKNDFRLSSLSSFMRKYWIDEIPMVFNLLKGDLKLFGVRPISKHYFNLYSDKLKNERIKHKPGFIPPFYSDLPNTLEEIMESEFNYLIKYNKSPIKTDITYFFKSLYNVFILGKRSS